MSWGVAVARGPAGGVLVVLVVFGGYVVVGPGHAAKGATKQSVHLTVEVNGDLLIHAPVWQRALADGHGTYDFTPMLREIAPYLKGADLAIQSLHI